jgi:hypothetical protein
MKIFYNINFKENNKKNIIVTNIDIGIDIDIKEASILRRRQL